MRSKGISSNRTQVVRCTNSEFNCVSALSNGNYYDNDRQGFYKLLDKGFQVLCFMTFPMTVGMALVAPQAVEFLYGEAFEPAVLTIRLMCPLILIKGLTPDFLDVLEEGFKEFFEKEVPGNPQKAEYLIPIFIGKLLEQGKMSVKVLKTNDTWYGMTYHEDVAAVKDSFKKMLENGVYKADLFADL